MKLSKRIICSISALAMCLSFTGLSADAATTYKKGDVNGDGTVNSQDALCAKQFLLGRVGAIGTAPERLDANKDCIINENDVAIVKNIVLGLSNTSTITYTSENDHVTQISLGQFELYYNKFNASNGSSMGEYQIPLASNISSNSSRMGIMGEDDRYIDYSQSGVVIITNGTKILGTGFIVDSDKIVTAAHVLYDTENNIPYSNIKYILYNSSGKKIDINGNVVSNQNTYMGINANSYHIPKMYISAAKYDTGYSTNNDYSNGSGPACGFYQDYALIKVNEDLSAYQSFDVGVFRNGIANKSPAQKIFVTGYNTTNSDVIEQNGANPNLSGKIVTGSGFLCNAPSRGDKITDKNLFYNVDIINGESGGPIYTKNSDGSKTVVGINTGVNQTFNQGTRFNSKILTFIYQNPKF